MNYSRLRSIVCQSLFAALLAGTVPLASAFTYSDGDLLLVFRKDGFKDVEFNVGSVSNLLGRANGTKDTIINWHRNLDNTTSNTNVNGLNYVLRAATDTTNALRRDWATSSSLNPLTP